MHVFLIAATAVFAALGVFWMLTPNERFQFGRTDSIPKPSRKRRPEGDKLKGREQLLWLAGLPFPASLLVPTQVVLGGISFALTFSLSGNVVVAGIIGVFGFQGPVVILKNMALSRWRLADREAYVLTNTLRFVLPVQGHPITALRQLVPGLEEPLKGWLSAALAEETVGSATEKAIYDLGVRLGHPEIQLLAEILRADRREKPASDLLAELLEAWTDRVRSDQKRHAKLNTTRRFTNLIIGVPVALFVLLPLLSPGTASVFRMSFVGQVVAAVGMLLFWFAAVVVQSTIRRSQEVRL